jgi:flagellar M-ring protein FliF
MPNTVTTLLGQMRQVWRQFETAQRMSIIMALFAAICVIGGLLYWSARPDYRLVYSNLTLEDASKMREKLDDAKIKVRLGQSGQSISVPASDLYTARLMLAAEGLPGDSSTGFELFEEPKFGLTDFAQKVNYQRALQGELERTIGAMQGVRSARVMLVLPKEQLFATAKERTAQASILLNLNGAVALGDAQVQSIVQLVSGAVQNLDASQVVVTDQLGHMLTRAHAGGDMLEESSEQLAMQARAEKRLEDKAQAILDQVLGVGKSIVRVSLVFDFTDMEQQAQVYDSENRVATSERVSSEDKVDGRGGSSGGPAGLMANVSVSNPSQMRVDEKNSNKKEELLTEYVVPSTISKTHRKGARIEQTSVAVCLAQGAEKRSEDELKAISQLIANAVGASAERKDSIQVTEMAFSVPEAAAKAAWGEQIPFRLDELFKGAGGLVVLGAVFGVARRLKNTMMAGVPQMDSPLNEVTQQVQDYMPDDKPKALRDQLAIITEMARENPKTVANWITNTVSRNG